MNPPDSSAPASVTEPVAFAAMGSEFEVLALIDLDSAAQHVRAETAAIEARFTRFSRESELSSVNSKAGEWVPVSGDMFEVLTLALEAQAWTGGIFNPLVLTAMLDAGYPSERGPAGTSGPFDGGARIQLDVANRSVRVPPGHGLDLGGLVKGWAADRLVRRVLPNGFVNAGGDVRAVGPGEDDFGWMIGIEDARRPGHDAFLIALRDEAAATSGRNRRHWTHQGRDSHHLIDPRTGVPAQTDLLAVTVVAPSCWRAETAAKTAAILGSEPGLAFLEENHLDGVLVRDDGSWVATEGMRRRFL